MSIAELHGRTVLVTGGAGFIGSELVRQAAEAGAAVVAVDNLVNGKRENLAGVLGNQVRLEVVDIRDAAAMERLLTGVDIVYHLACLGVRHSIHDAQENHAVNATATLSLLSEARDKAVGRFVYISTSEVYGTARTVPMTEAHPTLPHTVYGGAKLAGECYARAFHDTHGYDTVVVRPFNAYGPHSHHEGDSGEVIPKFMLRCLAGEPMVVFGDGSQTRDFTFVADTARGILAAGVADGVVGETINLGQGAEISIRELADQVKAVLDRPDATVEFDDPRPGDVLRLYADPAKARALLGFEPRVSLAEGLARLRDWYNAAGADPAALLRDEVRHNWEVDEGPSSGSSAT